MGRLPGLICEMSPWVATSGCGRLSRMAANRHAGAAAPGPQGRPPSCPRHGR
jgi:hypothetical protein